MAQWLKCCATNQKVAGSIPAGVIGVFMDIKSFRLHYGPGVNTIAVNEYIISCRQLKNRARVPWNAYFSLARGSVDEIIGKHWSNHIRLYFDFSRLVAE